MLRHGILICFQLLDILSKIVITIRATRMAFPEPLQGAFLMIGMLTRQRPRLSRVAFKLFQTDRARPAVVALFEGLDQQIGILHRQRSATRAARTRDGRDRGHAGALRGRTRGAGGNDTKMVQTVQHGQRGEYRREGGEDGAEAEHALHGVLLRTGGEPDTLPIGITLNRLATPVREPVRELSGLGLGVIDARGGALGRLDDAGGLEGVELADGVRDRGDVGHEDVGAEGAEGARARGHGHRVVRAQRARRGGPGALRLAVAAPRHRRAARRQHQEQDEAHGQQRGRLERDAEGATPRARGPGVG